VLLQVLLLGWLRQHQPLLPVAALLPLLLLLLLVVVVVVVRLPLLAPLVAMPAPAVV
jgi:hypothetical protein